MISRRTSSSKDQDSTVSTKPDFYVNFSEGRTSKKSISIISAKSWTSSTPTICKFLRLDLGVRQFKALLFNQVLFNVGDDEFFSNPSNGKIAFTAPSVMDLYGRPFDDFNGSTPLPDGNDFDAEFYVEVVNSKGEVLDCSPISNCEIQYERRFTPMLYEVVPNQIYKNQFIDWWIDIQQVHSGGTTPTDRVMFEELSIDGNQMLNEYYLDTNDRYVAVG